MNDPNGLAQFKGKYYFFYQWNRFATNHTYKAWGLFTSEDLVHWQDQGAALLPDQADDKDGVYSGSAVTANDKLYLFYTGNSRIQGKRQSHQKMAWSTDGQTFIKQDMAVCTPTGLTENHRDPKVWQHAGKWWMVTGAQTETDGGAVALFESADLKRWCYQGILYAGSDLDQMCECPDVFSLSPDADILTVCPQKRTSASGTDTAISSFSGYLVGKINYQQKKFIVKQGLAKLDFGFDFYAPQTFVDDHGRRIMTAWMSRMTAAEEQACPTIAAGYVHCLTMPRELKWQHQQLYQQPLVDYQQLRKVSQTYIAKSDHLENDSPAYEVVVKFKATPETFSLTLNGGANMINFDKGQLAISRVNWVSGKQELKKIPLASLDKLQIFNDHSTMEIFINDGQSVFSMRIFNDGFKHDGNYQGLPSAGKLTFYHY